MTADCAQELQALHDKLKALAQAGDKDGLAKEYAEHVCLLPPQHEPLLGRDAVVQYQLQRMQQQQLKSISGEVQDAAQIGDWAVERGRYHLESSEGKASGNYVMIWKKEEGAWKLRLEIYN